MNVFKIVYVRKILKMKILCLGDLHGDEHGLRESFRRAQNLECDLIIQLGDFGYWEHTPHGKYYLDQIQGMIRKFGMPLIFIDGNHENHVMLMEYMDSPFQTTIPDCDLSELKQIREGLGWIPRGAIFTLENTSFMGMGGSYSVDRRSRKLGVTYWEQEMVSIADIKIGIARYEDFDAKIDFLLTHDTYWGAPMDLLLPSGINPDRIPECAAVRHRLRDLVDCVQPDYTIHGHYHTRATYDVELGSGHVVHSLGLAASTLSIADIRRGSHTKDYDYRFSQLAQFIDTQEETGHLRP